MLKRVIPFVALFSSLATLVCCALPALLVTLGLGASLVSLLGNFPQLIWLSENKILVFALSGIMLASTAIIRWKWRDLSCPTDPDLARACMRTRMVSTVIFYGSLFIYAIGGFFAFIAPWVFF